VSILSDLFPPLLARISEFMGQMVGAALMAFISWRVWLQGERLLTYNEVTMELRVPKGMIAQGMSVLLAITAVAFAICAIEAVRRSSRNAQARTGSF
jgi:TRAP-type C4-dicarboxylate transport system permease small subunit